MSALDHDFFQQLASLGEPYPRFKWYVTAIVALSALNYPEEIGPLYTHLLQTYITPQDHFEETRKIKEALVKACGLHGAAKVCMHDHLLLPGLGLISKHTGNAMRVLYLVTPDHLKDSTCYRENDDAAVAIPRGDAFLKSLYRDVPDINTEDDYVRKTSPDYFHLVSKHFYPYIFSFDKILDSLESSQAIISSLIGIDCAGQARNHMKGMMWNGATREEVTMIRDIVVLIAEKLDVRFKAGPIPVPELPDLQ